MACINPPGDQAWSKLYTRTERRQDVFTHIIRWIYVVSAWLIFVVVIVQFFLAGLGVFAGDFQMHVALGYTIFFLMLLVLVIALVARLPWRTLGLTALLPVLVFLQSIFIEAWSNGLAT
jgi:hypothetical protein